MPKKITFLKSLLVTTALIIGGNNVKAQTLEAHYKFDNSIADATGNWNLTATDADNSLTYETGKDGTANGAISGFTLDDYLSTSGDFSISADQTRTMTAWIKLIATTPQTAVVGLGVNSPGEKWTFGHQGIKVRTEINGKGIGVGAMEVGTWHHIATVWDSSTQSLMVYLDGTQRGATVTNWSGIVNTAVAPMLIGNDYNATPSNRGFNGALDDVRIYSGVAADSDFILNIYNETLAVNSITKESFDAYPNPVVDVLSFSTNDVASVDIYNTLGAKVASKNAANGVDMSNLVQGVYYVVCKNKNDEAISTIKAVKN